MSHRLSSLFSTCKTRYIHAHITLLYTRISTSFSFEMCRYTKRDNVWWKQSFSKRDKRFGDLDENDKARLFSNDSQRDGRTPFLVERKWIKQKRKGKVCYNFSFLKNVCRLRWWYTKTNAVHINKKLDVYPLPISLNSLWHGTRKTMSFVYRRQQKAISCDCVKRNLTRLNLDAQFV